MTGASQVTCQLCQPPEVVGERIFDHLRLFHPDMHDQLTGGTRGPLTDTVPGPPAATAQDVQAGECCCRCGRPFRLGERWAEILHGLVGEIPVVEVICLKCSDEGISDD